MGAEASTPIQPTVNSTGKKKSKRKVALHNGAFPPSTGTYTYSNVPLKTKKNTDTKTVVLDDIQRRRWKESTVEELKLKPTEEIWHLLAEYAGSFLPEEIVMKWDPSTVKKIVMDLSSEGFFEKRLRHKGRVRHYIMQVAAELERNPDFPITHNRKVTFPDIVVPYNYAAQLLEIDPNLANLRLKLVPGARVHDHEFWSQYFQMLSCRIRKHILETLGIPYMKVKKNKDDNNTTDGWLCIVCDIRNPSVSRQCGLCEKPRDIVNK